MAELDYAVPSSTTSYTVQTSDGLVSGTKYSFLVIATNYVGDSAESGILVDVIAGTPPSIPLNLQRAPGVTPDDTKITLDWDEPSSNGGTAVTGYSLYWDAGTQSGLPTTLLTTTTNTFGQAENLTPGTSYSFKVLATNEVGSGQATDPVTLIAAEAPGVPSDIVRLSFDSETQMLIGWTPPTDDGGTPGAIDYAIHTDNGLASGYSELVGTTGGATSYLVTGLTADTTYFFKISAKNEVGESEQSTSAGFKAGSVPSIPLALTLEQ